MDSQDIPSIVESDDIPSISEDSSTPVTETPKQEAVAVVTDASQEHNSIEFETTQEIDETIQNVTLYSDARVKKPENFNSVERPIDEILGLPQYSTAKLQDILKRLPNIDFGDAKDIQRWKLRLNESLEAGTFDDLFKDALERKDSDWVKARTELTYIEFIKLFENDSLSLQTKLEMFYDFLYERGVAKQLGVGIDTIVKHFIDEKLLSNDR